MNQVLDMAVVDELLSLGDDGDPELLLDLIELFLADGPVKVAALMEGLAAGDFEQMERAAHTLKGSSGNLGARLLQETCEQLQLSTRNHDLETTRRLAPLVPKQLAEATAALEDLRRRHSRP